MNVNVRLFASLRELSGSSELDIVLPDGATVTEALAVIAEDSPLKPAIDSGSLVVAVNREYADGDHALRAGDEIALIPPVSGGALSVSVEITSQPLDLAEISAEVVDPAAGAIVTFQGMTRGVPMLHYEAYTEMAEEKLNAIALQTAGENNLVALSVRHRIGEVPLSEPSVIVAASAAHREEAFAAARQIIDRIKQEAPIWKKEIEAGEERWVEGNLPKPD